MHPMNVGGDDEVVSVGFDDSEEHLGSALDVLVEDGLSLMIQDAEIDGLGVEVDAPVVGVGFVVESRGPLSWWSCYAPTSLLRVE